MSMSPLPDPSPVLDRPLHVPDRLGEAGVPDPRDLRIRNLSAAMASGDLLASYALGVVAIRAALAGSEHE